MVHLRRVSDFTENVPYTLNQAFGRMGTGPRGPSFWHLERFRGGLAFKAYRLLYYSTLDSRVIKKKRRKTLAPWVSGFWCRVSGLGLGLGVEVGV